MQRQAASPGKLILSGEHAVVQGCPALAMAVDLEARVTFTPLDENHLKIVLPERPPRYFPVPELQQTLKNTRKSHAAYLAGELPFTQLMHEPETLLAVCAGLAGLSSGAELRFESTLPPGSGLGSSAAFILSLMKVINPGLSHAELRKRAIEGEHFQHGRSSGLDVAVSLQGGILWFQDGKDSPVPLSAPLPPFRIYHSGKPESSTGECVELSRKIFSQTPSLKDEFCRVTHNTLRALQNQDMEKWKSCIRENHLLLCQLGVVPYPVQKAISRLADSGYTAKICGAGSLLGKTAGMVLVPGSEPHPVPGTWQALPLNLSLSGTRILS